MTHVNESDRVRSLLQRVDQNRRPSEAERQKIERDMWANLARVELRGDDDIPVRPVQAAESVRPNRRPAQTAAPVRTARRSRRLLMAAAAAVLLLVVIPLGARLLDREAPALDLEVAATEPVVRFSATVGGVPLSFSATEPASLGESGSDFLAVRATEASNPFGATADSTTGQVILSRPMVLFDGEDPDVWFAKHEIQVEPVTATYQGQRILAWNLIIPEGSAGDANCDARVPCLEFARLASGRSLSLEQGFELNRISLIPVEDSDRPIVVSSLYGGPRQGPSDDPVAKLRLEILTSLRLGGCALNC